MINVTLYMRTNVVVNSILCMNIVYLRKNINTSKNIVNIVKMVI